MEKKNDEITFKSLVKIFLPALWVIALVSVIFAAAIGIFSHIQPDRYTSKGKYMVVKVNSSDNNALTGLNGQEIDAMRAMVSNFSEIIDTENFARSVVDKLTEINIVLSTSQVKKMMSVNLSGQETTCYYFTVTSLSGEYSQAVAEVAGQLLVEVYQEVTNYAINIVRIDDPVLPSSPDGKNEIRNALIGFAAGFLLSMIAIFVTNRLDIMVRNRDDIEETFDLPVLGLIPKYEVDSEKKNNDGSILKKGEGEV